MKITLFAAAFCLVVASFSFAQTDRRIPRPAGLVNKVLATGEKANLDLSTPLAGARVYYTTDGSTPTGKGTLYTKPLQIDITETGRVDVKAIVVLANGRKSPVYTATMLRSLWIGPQPDPKNRRAGVTYSLYVPSNAYGQDTVPVTGETRSLGIEQFKNRIDPKQTWGVSFDGFFNVPVDAIYEFQIDSTNDRQLTIDGQTLIDEAGTKDRAVTSALVPLRAGWHKIALHYDHREGEPIWRVRWAIKGQNWRGLELVH